MDATLSGWYPEGKIKDLRPTHAAMISQSWSEVRLWGMIFHVTTSFLTYVARNVFDLV